MAGQEPLPRTRTGARMGTPEYMAPEQCVEAARVSAKADVYALGVTLYELVCGRRPFLAEHAVELMTQHVRKQPRSLKRLAPKTPDALAALIHAMLRKRPEARPTMAEVAAQLEEFSHGVKDATSSSSATATPALITPSSSELTDSEHEGELADVDFNEPFELFGNRRVSRWRFLRSAALLALTIGLTTAATLAATSWRHAKPIPARLTSQPPAQDSRPAPPVSVAPPAPSAPATPAPAPKPAKALTLSAGKGNASSAGKHSSAAAATGKAAPASSTLFEDLTPINP